MYSVFEKVKARTSTKIICISKQGMNLWNNLEDKLKMCRTTRRFKGLCKRGATDKIA